MNFTDWLLGEEWAGDSRNPKLVIVLGAPGSGKTYVAEKFRQRGFRMAILDQYFEALRRKKAGTDKISVSIQDPKQKQDHVWAAVKNDRRIDHYLKQGYPFVTEKTGQNYGTIASLKKMAESFGYTVFAVYVDVDVEKALDRNRQRNRSLPDDELRRTHSKVRSNMEPSTMGAGLAAMFGDKFYRVENTGTPESNDQIEKVLADIASKVAA